MEPKQIKWRQEKYQRTDILVSALLSTAQAQDIAATTRKSESELGFVNTLKESTCWRNRGSLDALRSQTVWAISAEHYTAAAK